ncbi:HIT family protein [Desulforamulus aeronauticus]|uniref:Diadenosine tetraphosphate (Ap4A) hydrolase n=1 Tax=Desulforamulus aeronauticus DSM 10349 TaxID=1121421 RepID=A0A1M6WTX8_9FIRM|nr:HIT domain-containing protein [Desulforamulus aeronauticus]SHK97101.1 Diadenosine tetraphosphate (Ap4A) hydrolase [Desulforamulus aeronauticus DSM 10349]
MENLWAPWRSVYIGKPQVGCIFCEKLTAKQDKENLVVHRGDKTFVIMNLYPYNNGHLLVAPKRHVGDITELTDEELLELNKMTQFMVQALRRAFGNPHGFNIGINLGKVAGAGIPGHLHVHIVPRWDGDANFMAVIGETRVISEALERTYDKIVDAVASLNSNSHARS